MKINSNELGHMTNMAAMPIYGKNLKNLLLQNQSTDDLETWYVALSKIVQIISLGWPWLILRQGQVLSHKLLYGKKWKLFIFF